MSTQKFNIRLHAVILIVALLISPIASARTTHMVTIGNNFFSPTNLTIEPGDTVRWTNASSGNLHNVTSVTGVWTPSPTALRFTFDVTFDDPGSFDYLCTLHSSMQQGNITVVSAETAELRESFELLLSSQ